MKNEKQRKLKAKEILNNKYVAGYAIWSTRNLIRLFFQPAYVVGVVFLFTLNASFHFNNIHHGANTIYIDSNLVVWL